VVTFPIPLDPHHGRDHALAFTNVTSQVAGHSSYQIAIDTTAWQPADQITIQIEFRIDNVIVTNSGCKITTTGGAHHDIQGNPIFPSCGAAIPTFQTNLAARAIVTVPSSGTIQGSIDLI
jgi:hypothetical protein